VSCGVAREFLGAHSVVFSSWDVDEPAGREAWHAAGNPHVPALVIGSRAISLVSPRFQIAGALGLPSPQRLAAGRLLWDVAAIQEAWLALVRSVDWRALTMPTRSRGRTPIELVANVFNFYAELADAWAGRPVSWGGPGTLAAEAALVARLTDEAAVVSYVAEQVAAWQLFALDASEADPEGARLVANREGGTVVFRELLDAQRQHGAQHLRQVIATYAERAIPHAGRDPRELVPDLELPDDPF